MSDRKQFFLGIMSTAIEGGIDYWASVRNVVSDEDLNYLSYEVRDFEDKTMPWKQITPEVVEETYKKILDPNCTLGLSVDVVEHFAEAYKELDAGMLDASDADVIIQVAAFGYVACS
jgi:hypothetical protein